MSAVGLPEVAAPEQINNMERPMHAYTVKTRSTSGAQTLCAIARHIAEIAAITETA